MSNFCRNWPQILNFWNFLDELWSSFFKMVNLFYPLFPRFLTKMYPMVGNAMVQHSLEFSHLQGIFPILYKLLVPIEFNLRLGGINCNKQWSYDIAEAQKHLWKCQENYRPNTCPLNHSPLKSRLAEEKSAKRESIKFLLSSYVNL